MKYKLMFLALVVWVGSLSAQSFTTNVNSLREAVVATHSGKKYLVVSGLDGEVAAYSLAGDLKWKNRTDGRALLFEIQAADLNQDGTDEVLGASADGNVYAWSNNGDLLWKFNPGHKVRFNDLAVLRQGRKTTVLAGGNDFFLYEINAHGQLVSKTPIEGTVRIIATGNFLEEGKPSIYLMTYQHDKFRWLFNGFLDAESKKVVKSFDKVPKSWDRFMINKYQVVDLDGNGLDDILVMGHVPQGGCFFGYDSDFNTLAEFRGKGADRQRYAHGTGTVMQQQQQIALQYGGVMYVTDFKGRLLHRGGVKNRGIIFNSLVYEPQSNQLLGIGEVGGGNAIYSTSLEEDGWWEKSHQPQGRMAEVEQNLNTLYKQILDFKMPSYQKKSSEEWVMITNIPELPALKSLKGAEVKYVKQYNWHEVFDRSELVAAIGKEALKRDRRMKYVDSQEKILREAAELERKGIPFVSWTGHGNDPFFVSIETMEKILEVAPTMCYGFTYAEMENSSDPRYNYFVDHYIPRLAAACRKQGRAKIYFRYKNIFWAANAHREPWRRMFFSGRYNDVLVPAAEDTNSRTQELNFSGRSGMFSAGYVNDFAMRLVDDNPTSWRPYTPGGQRSVSPYLRSGVMYAAYGARYGLIFPIGYLENPGMNILFALMKSGVLPLAKKEDILSIGSWHLVKDMDNEVVDGISSGHDLTLYDENDGDAVLSYGKLCWAGTNVPDYDYSKMLGVDYRWLNFTPSLPYGMLPVAPYEYAKELDKKGIPYVVSNWKKGFVDGKWLSAKEFGAVMQKTARIGAEKMPVLVSGAAWSAIRIDAKHVRVILADPGYIDPQERKVVIHLQQGNACGATDILSRQTVEISNNKLELTVPAGSCRFIDFEFD